MLFDGAAEDGRAPTEEGACVFYLEGEVEFDVD